MSSKHTRKLAAIMFTDIQGYTALMQESEAKALSVRAKHREVFDKLTEKYQGQLINYFGDGTLSIFDSPVDAVNCGYELQRQFLEEPKIPVRIGIHMGDIVVTEDDIIGDSVNIASRVESLAVVGSVLFSDKVKAEISNQDNIKFTNVGTYHLKNDENPREIFALDMPALIVPELGTLKGKTVQKSKELTGSSSEQSQSLWKNPKLWLLLVSLVALGMFTKSFITKKKGERWAKETALPQIEKYRDQRNHHDAYMLAMEAEKFLKNDTGLENLWSRISVTGSINSDPVGAEVYRKVYDAPEEEWELLGITPLRDFNTYRGVGLFKFVLEDYEESIRFDFAGRIMRESYTIQLDKTKNVPEGMARIEDCAASLDPIVNVDNNNVIEPIQSFLVDKHETTNEEYQSFVNAGGYEDPKYWQFPFIKNGEELTFQETTSLFVDKTGRHGPPNWELGEFPEGMDLYPVQGVSWHEAAAFSVFAGKALPTLFHWENMASISASELVVPNSNIQNQALAAVGEFKGITSSGLYDIAGNVREWLFNKGDWNVGRYVIGGSWNSAQYEFNETLSIDPFDRSLINGFRCIKYLEPNDNQNVLGKSIDKRQVSFEVGDPVPDDIYELYIRQFAFDKSSLKITSEQKPINARDRTCQRIEFDAPYGKERMSGYLYLPTNAKPPYQVVVYFPGAGAFWPQDFDWENNRQLDWVDFMLKSGRALFFPVLKSTYDRKDGLRTSSPSASTGYRDHAIIWVKEIVRSVDVLETLPVIDTSKIIYCGLSWGARMAALNLAIEPRFKTGVLIGGGVSILTPLEEVAEYTYLPRVKIPVVMLNGEHDNCCFPVEAAQKPFFNLLGTPQADKKHVIFKNTSHLPSRADLIRETLDWLDKYMGKVELLKNEVASNVDREM